MWRLTAILSKLTKTMKNRILRLFSALLLSILLSACGIGAQGTNPSDGSENPNDQYKVLAVDQGKQSITFSIKENIAFMEGVMDSSITDKVRQLMADYPKVDSIVMLDVPGTLDFRATLEAGRLIHDACLTTIVPEDGFVASGGVYFFLAGCERYVDQTALVGVHTWRSYTLDENENKNILVAGIDLPPSDPAHDTYLDFHNDMNIQEEFYWLIVNTPFDDVYYLNSDDIYNYEIAEIISYENEFSDE